jgi:hypothetical protein
MEHSVEHNPITTLKGQLSGGRPKKSCILHEKVAKIFIILISTNWNGVTGTTN